MRNLFVLLILISLKIFSSEIEEIIKNDDLIEYKSIIEEVQFNHLEKAVDEGSNKILQYIIEKKPKFKETFNIEYNYAGYNPITLLTKEIFEENYLKANHLKNLGFKIGFSMDKYLEYFSKSKGEFDSLVLAVHPIITGFYYDDRDTIGIVCPMPIEYLAIAFISPKETIDKIFSYLPKVKTTVGDDIYYKTLHTYLEAISRIDYTENLDFYRGITTLSGKFNYQTELVNEIYENTGDYIWDSDLSNEEYLEHNIYRAENFFKEIGLFATSLFIEKVFKDLYENRETNQVAMELYNKYSSKLIPLYNNFVNDWNNNLPLRNTNLTSLNLTYYKIKYPKLMPLNYEISHTSSQYDEYYFIRSKEFRLRNYLESLSKESKLNLDLLKELGFSGSKYQVLYYYKLQYLGLLKQKELFNLIYLSVILHPRLSYYGDGLKANIDNVSYHFESGLTYVTLDFINRKINYLGNHFDNPELYHCDLTNYFMDYTLLSEENYSKYDDFIGEYIKNPKEKIGKYGYFINEDKLKEFENSTLKSHKESLEVWDSSKRNFEEAFDKFNDISLLPWVTIGPYSISQSKYVNLMNDYVYFASNLYSDNYPPLTKEQIIWIFYKLIETAPKRHTLYLNLADFYLSLDDIKYEKEILDLYRTYLKLREGKSFSKKVKKYVDEHTNSEYKN